MAIADLRNRSEQGLTAGHVKHSFTCMLKSIAKIGNSQGLILDAALLEVGASQSGG